MSHEEEEDQLGGIRGVDELASRGVVKGLAGFSIVTELHETPAAEKLPPTRKGGIKATQLSEEEISSPTYKPPILPTYDCDKCGVIAVMYCDYCGFNLCDVCDNKAHEGLSQEELGLHYRDPIASRLAAMAAELAPHQRPPPTPSQIAASQTGSVAPSQTGSGISVGGLYDLIAPQEDNGPTRSEQAYEEACRMAEIRAQFRDVCDNEHAHPETKDQTPVYATVYCDTCGLNYCSDCDNAKHPDGSDHERYPLEYKPDAPLPRSKRDPNAAEDPDEAERRAAIETMANYQFSPVPTTPNDSRKFGNSLTLADADDGASSRFKARGKIPLDQLDKLPLEVRLLVLKQRAGKLNSKQAVRAMEYYKQVENERLQALKEAERSRDDSDAL